MGASYLFLCGNHTAISSPTESCNPPPHLQQRTALLPCLYCGTYDPTSIAPIVSSTPGKTSLAVLLILFSGSPATHSHFSTFYDMTFDDRASLFSMANQRRKTKKKSFNNFAFSFILHLSLGIYQVFRPSMFFSVQLFETLNRFEVGRSLGRRCEISL